MKMGTDQTPIDLARMRALLRSEGTEFRDSTDSVLTLDTDRAVFTWSVANPQVIQISARWRGVAQSSEHFQTLRGLVSDCNSSCAFPKAYMIPLAVDGQYTVGGECNLLSGRGVTEDQFYGFVERSATALHNFLAQAELKLPQLVTWEVHS